MLRVARFLLLTVGILFAPAVVPAAERPNVVLIFADNLGMNDVGCYGSEIPTPNIDRIARDGVRFTHWYSAAPVCTPSRFGLLTGRYPNRSQDQLLSALMFLEPKDANRGIRLGETTLAHVLRKAGYRTAAVGKWHLGHSDPQFLPTRHGFDSFYGYTGGTIDYFRLKYHDKPCWFRDEKLVEESGYAPDLLTAEAVRFLERQNSDQPFFLYFPCNVGHYGRSLDAAGKPVSLLQPHEKYLPRVAAIPAGKRRDYAATIVAMDEGIGQLLATLRKRQLDENTLVIWLSDNGPMLDYGGSSKPHKGGIRTVWEGGLRVPCVMRWPGKTKPASVSRQLASSLDVFPTLSRILGAKTASLPLDGIDLTPVLLEGKELPRDLFWRTGDGADAFRRGPWKFVRTAAGEELLFDVEADPGEEKNLAGKHADKVAELREAHRKIAGTFGKK